MQQRNPLLNFSNLYKYLKVLHKSEHLPQLTPAGEHLIVTIIQVSTYVRLDANGVGVSNPSIRSFGEN